MKIKSFIFLKSLILLQFIRTGEGTSNKNEDSNNFDLVWCKLNENKYDNSDDMYLEVQIMSNRNMGDGTYLSHDGGNTKLHLVSYGPIYNICEKGGQRITKFRVYDDEDNVTYVHDYYSGRNIPISEFNGYTLLFANVGNNVEDIPSHYFLLDAVTGDYFTKDGNINPNLSDLKIGYQKNPKGKGGDRAARKFELKGKLLRFFDKNNKEIENVKLTSPKLFPCNHSQMVNPGEQVYFKLEDITLNIYNRNRKPFSIAPTSSDRFLSIKLVKADPIPPDPWDQELKDCFLS